MNKTLCPSNLNGIVVYTEFDEFLTEKWKTLYEQGANYNLSYEWCSLWYKYFSKNKPLHIITFWENGDLRLLAPFFKRRNTLYLIGTKPDLYDEFNVLYENEKYLAKLFSYIKDNYLQICFKHINIESAFAKHLIKWLYVAGIKYQSHVVETKPSIIGEFHPSKNLREDMRRCRNNAKNLYNSDFEFTLNIDRDKKSIQEFISLHKTRWGGGLLEKKANVEKFIEDIFLNTDLITMSSLALDNSKENIAYLLSYLDSRKTLWISMTAYKYDYKKISPGKMLFSHLITNVYGKCVNKIDFGRGSEGYKTWFANYDEGLFDVTSYNSKYFFKISSLVNKILKLIYS